MLWLGSWLAVLFIRFWLLGFWLVAMVGSCLAIVCENGCKLSAQLCHLSSSFFGLIIANNFYFLDAHFFAKFPLEFALCRGGIFGVDVGVPIGAASLGSVSYKIRLHIYPSRRVPGTQSGSLWLSIHSNSAR